MSEAKELQALRREVAAAHGLTPAAASFLAGSTLAEVEAQAAQLAALGASRQERQEQPPAGLFTPATTTKAERQRALVRSLHPAVPQPRDQAGRFESPAVQDGSRSGFDGGARAPVPGRPETHNEWLGRALRTGSVDVGRHLGLSAATA